MNDIRLLSQEYVSEVRTIFQPHADAGNALPMKKYMKNHFEFLGIKKPERAKLSKDVITKLGIPEPEILKEVCFLCFQEEQREMQYFVYDLIGGLVKKLDDSFLDMIESLIIQKSWWDTVDFLAPKLAGNILLRYPNKISEYPKKWIESENIWLQRSAILFQLDYKNKTNQELLYEFILKRADSKEFFVQKAAGWALREYSKTNPGAVKQFIMNHTLPKLTVREGLKRIND
ncbi:MAG: DNA alkylation repair protein [Saprospiraceae bacterium]|nr:DNA alkylation repair protein [Saprospiraceae bacterium]